MPVILIICAVLIACGRNTTETIDEQGKLIEIAELVDIEFSPDAKIVFAENDERANEKVSLYVVYTAAPVQFKIQPSFKKPAEDTRESLQGILKSKTLGKVKNKWANCYEGKLKNGSWKIYQTNLENGSYLHIQKFIF